jgi:glucose-6-phosphate isomerase
MFEFWDWVGGRYSLWSAIGLSLCLGLGFERFEELLRGAEAADLHFRTADFAQNIPVIMGLQGIWYRNFLGYRTYAVLPYDQNLSRFSAFLQQADMESNGKCAGRDGKPLNYATAAVVWGEPGTNGQHAFYQFLHQGSDIVPIDFIGSIEPSYPLGQQHSMLLANMLAQAEAFMNGLSEREAREAMMAEGRGAAEIEELIPFRVFEGNRPSNTLLLNKLDPYSLGMLTALYEHKIFVQGVIWNVFSFDQWGVELGKKLAKPILNSLINNDLLGIQDSFTRANLERISAYRSRQ